MQRALLQEVQAYARTNGYQLVSVTGVLYASRRASTSRRRSSPRIKSNAPGRRAPRQALSAGRAKGAPAWQ